MQFMTPYKYTRERSADFATHNNEESMTQQSDRDDSDINVIVGKFFKTGQLPKMKEGGIGGDFSTAGDFRDMVEKINTARDDFNSLPAKVRKEFDNDPAKFIDFVQNPANIEEIKKMGLTAPEKVKETTLDDINTTLKTLKEPPSGKDQK